MRIRAWIVVASLALAGPAGCGGAPRDARARPDAAGPGAEPVRFARTEDGLSIAVDLRGPRADGPAPLVVLGHQLDRDRASWEPLAAALRDAGWATAAFDHRGFGESVREVPSPAELTAGQRDRLHLDWRAAVALATADPRVDATRIVLAASGISVDPAVRTAQEDSRVRALVLLPGMMDPSRRDYLLERPDFPVLFVAAGGHERERALVRQYAGRFTGPAQEYTEFPPTESDPADWSGTDGLTPAIGLVDVILWFLSRHAPREPGG